MPFDRTVSPSKMTSMTAKSVHLQQPRTESMRSSEETYHAEIYEDTPAYQVLKEHKVLDARFRVQAADDLVAEDSNSDPWTNTLLDIFCCPCVVGRCIKTFMVPAAQ